MNETVSGTLDQILRELDQWDTWRQVVVGAAGLAIFGALFHGLQTLLASFLLRKRDPYEVTSTELLDAKTNAGVIVGLILMGSISLIWLLPQ